MPALLSNIHSGRSSEPTTHLDMRQHWCANLSHDVYARSIQLARGEKRALFKMLQQATAPYNLTSRKPATWCRRHVPRHSLKVMFVGDSIVNELRDVLRKLVPTNSSFYHFDRLTTFDGEVKQNNQTVRPWNMLAAERYDAVFVGLAQLWRLQRPTREQPTSGVKWDVDSALLPYLDVASRRLYSPYKLHRAYVSAWVRRLDCLARALELPIVLVGTMTVDVQTLLLNPPKHDWSAWHDYGLTEIWAAAEHDIEAEVCANVSSSRSPTGRLLLSSCRACTRLPRRPLRRRPLVSARPPTRVFAARPQRVHRSSL